MDQKNSEIGFDIMDTTLGIFFILFSPPMSLKPLE